MKMKDEIFFWQMKIPSMDDFFPSKDEIFPSKDEIFPSKDEIFPSKDKKVLSLNFEG